MSSSSSSEVGTSTAGPPRDEIADLRALVEGTAAATGVEFFQSLVKHLAAAINTRYAFVAEFLSPCRARTLGYWKRGEVVANVEWDLRGTPCEDVVSGNLCHHPHGVWRMFPTDRAFVDWRIESYLGVPLRDADGKTLGHLAVFDDRAMPDEPRRLYLFRVFAARAAGELQRLRDRQMLADSEQRFRDLYEEAPIAYIYEDLESRFVRANRAAIKLLGLRPEEVPNTYGVTLLAPTPETTKKIADALDAMKTQGREFQGVELELRRKDDGRPIWVQWFSKPEPDGKHTRTMLIDITDRVLMEREKQRLEQQNQYLRDEIKSVHNFEEIVGRSDQIVSVLENVRRVAPTDATVLVTGETGTGKELVARAIHSAGGRRDRPLIKVNCAALPTTLVESELFGHEKGAFSGAVSRRVGRFELAHGGTIFLDEIGELPADVQSKLLRVLQEREFERVGGSASIKVDVRVIAATNRDLGRAVRDGLFREDLFYRLNVFPIHLPPLRHRQNDIPLIVQNLVEKFRSRLGKRLDGVSPETLARLVEYAWPGNIRELENVLERAAIVATTPIIDLDERQLMPPLRPNDSNSPFLPTAPTSVATLADAERQHILSALRSTNWVIDGPSGAARVLDMHPNTLRSRLKKLGISRAAHETS
jgi:PAS domain S-box-containing protein